MYTIEKTFEFDLAHRIHNQKLDPNFTENGKPVLKCRRIHGHTAQLKIKLGAEHLVDDMVLDYNELGFIRTMVNDILDHHTLLCLDDPIYEKVIKLIYMNYSEKETIYITAPDQYNTSKIILGNIEDDDIREFLSSFILVDFTTSSENIAKWISNIIRNRIDVYNYNNNTNIDVVSVSYKETPKSEAVYTPQKP